MPPVFPTPVPTHLEIYHIYPVKLNKDYEPFEENLENGFLSDVPVDSTPDIPDTIEDSAPN